MSKGLNLATRPAAATGEGGSVVAVDSVAGDSVVVVDSDSAVAEDSGVVDSVVEVEGLDEAGSGGASLGADV
jgi:hypothetical protein